MLVAISETVMRYAETSAAATRNITTAVVFAAVTNTAKSSESFSSR